MQLGKIRTDYQYYNSNYIWPIGYKSKKSFLSYKDATVHIYYFSEIVINPKSNKIPLFRVTAEDDKDNYVETTSPTSSWMLVLGKVQERKKAQGIRQSGTAISGPEYFGFSQDSIAIFIEGLEGSTECKG